MRLYVLFGLRKERYAGEYDLEALECMSEADYDGNAEFIRKSHQKHAATNEFRGLEIVTLDVNGAQIRRILCPEHLAVPATVIGAQPKSKEPQ